jgi:hypothetical protein
LLLLSSLFVVVAIHRYRQLSSQLLMPTLLLLSLSSLRLLLVITVSALLR